MSARRLAVIAGRGQLPPTLIRAAGPGFAEIRAYALDAATPDLGVPTERAALSQLPELFAAIKAFGATHVVLAGAIDLPRTARTGLARALGGSGHETGDVPLSNLAARIGALTGATLVSIPDIAPQLVVTAGVLAGPALSADDEARGQAALVAALGVGALDLGQSVVLADFRPIAAEDAGGTDALLRRVAQLRAAGQGGTPLTFAKAKKRQQPTFVDLPVIGPETIAGCVAAGITLIALEAGTTLIVDRDAVLSAAHAANITLWGGHV